MKSGRKKIDVLVLFFIGLIFLSSGINYNLFKGIYDEAMIIYGAERILQGDMIYRDFLTLYMPGEFFLVAAFFKLFGVSLITERFLTVIILSLICVFLYLILNKILSKKTAFLGWLLGLGILMLDIRYSSTVQPVILMILVSLLLLFDFFKIGQKKFLFFSSLFAVLTFLFRFDFGIALIMSQIVLLLIYIYKEKKNNFKLIGLYFFYIVIVFFPIAIYFLIRLKIYYFYNIILDIFSMPVFTFKFRKLPFPDLTINSFIFYLPPIVLLIALIKLLIHKTYNYKSIMCWGFLFLGSFSSLYTYARPDLVHLWPTLVFSVPLLIFIIDELIRKRKYRRYILNILILMMVFVCIELAFSFFYQEFFWKKNKQCTQIDLSRAKGFVGCHGNTKFQVEAVKYIRENTTKEEKIFVGNSRHDRIFINDNMFYFLAERDSATKVYVLETGIVSHSRKVQGIIIEDIKDNDVSYIVLWSGLEDFIEPNESGKATGITLLDDFIRENYKETKTFGPYSILKKM